MTDSITPPPELVEQWRKALTPRPNERESWIATLAARWGADQELEACCALMDDWGLEASDLRAARRPKPLSLKEQALDAHNRMMAGTETQDDWTIVRRALESISD
jgi:hypothetical protein